MDRSFEAGQTLDQVLNRIAAGEEIIITRHGQPVARLVPEQPVKFDTTARQAATAIIEASRTTTLGDLTLRMLIDEGRA